MKFSDWLTFAAFNPLLPVISVNIICKIESVKSDLFDTQMAMGFTRHSLIRLNSEDSMAAIVTREQTLRSQDIKPMRYEFYLSNECFGRWGRRRALVLACVGSHSGVCLIPVLRSLHSRWETHIEWNEIEKTEISWIRAQFWCIVWAALILSAMSRVELIVCPKWQFHKSYFIIHFGRLRGYACVGLHNRQCSPVFAALQKSLQNYSLDSVSIAKTEYVLHYIYLEYYITDDYCKLESPGIKGLCSQCALIALHCIDSGGALPGITDQIILIISFSALQHLPHELTAGRPRAPLQTNRLVKSCRDMSGHTRKHEDTLPDKGHHESHHKQSRTPIVGCLRSHPDNYAWKLANLQPNWWSYGF